MKQYHKIDSLFKRDTDGKMLFGEYSCPEFEYLKDNVWWYTEKVDGTNIRIMYQPEVPALGGEKMVPWISLGGKTDAAQIPAKLVEKLRNLFPVEKFEGFGEPMCLYGEGYGAGIQKGGGNYIKDGVDFILFDVKIGDWWLKRDSVEDIAKTLSIPVVPIIGGGSLFRMEKLCQEGFKSQWGDFIAEGIVARPDVELQKRGGERVITKLKHKDYNGV